LAINPVGKFDIGGDSDSASTHQFCAPQVHVAPVFRIAIKGHFP
jgi:hypothetical protein